MKKHSWIRWMKKNAEFASWIQAIGVLIAIVFGLAQLRQATEALKLSVQNNEIAMRNNASDLLVGINEAALNNPAVAGKYSGYKRLHLMRLHYFYRVFGLWKEGIIDRNNFEAETRYLQWATSLPGFVEIWPDFRGHYRSDFSVWVDETIAKNTISGESQDSIPVMDTNNVSGQ